MASGPKVSDSALALGGYSFWNQAGRFPTVLYCCQYRHYKTKIFAYLMGIKCYLVIILIFISIVTNKLRVFKNTFIDYLRFIFYDGSVYIFYSLFCQFVSFFFLLICKTSKNTIRIPIIWHICCENMLSLFDLSFYSFYDIFR